MSESIPGKEVIEKAHTLITPYIHRTPVMTSQFLNDLSGAELYFKCENFQKIGAFKARGGLECNFVTFSGAAKKWCYYTFIRKSCTGHSFCGGKSWGKSIYRHA